MKLNWIDRAIATVDPVRAASRAKARAQLGAFDALSGMQASAGGGYETANAGDRWAGRWQPRPRDAAADTLRDLPRLRAQSRDLARNSGIGASAINTNVVRAVGTGLAYSAKPHLATLGWSAEQSAEWCQEAQAEFSLFADSRECDWLGEQNFYEKQDLTLRSMLESGDVFTVLPDGERTATQPYLLRLQTLEADRVGNPQGRADDARMAGGVRRDERNPQRVEYHVYATHPGSSVWARPGMLTGEWMLAVGPSGRRRVLHHFKMLRPDAPRGVPYLAPVMSLFKLLGEYTDAEVKAAVVSAFLTVFIESDAAGAQNPLYQGPEKPPTGPEQNEIEMAAGAVIGMPPGTRANAVTPGRPNPAFGPFVEVVLDQLGAGTFIGREMLMKRYSTSYVAARAAFLDAWKHLLDMRTLLARSFCQPVLETWMAEAVARGRLRAPGFFADPRLRWAYTRAAWRGDSQGSINLKDEGRAYIDLVDARLITRERAEWELGGSDWNEEYPTMLTEHRRLQKDGMLPTPKAGAAAPQQQQGAPAADPAEPADPSDEGAAP